MSVLNRKYCFIIGPIGELDSNTRKKSNIKLNFIFKPCVEEYGYEIIRADNISDPGLITNQIISLLHSVDLVIADLTDLNPNVFYELGVRHTFLKPTIHFMERGQIIPFDVSNYRTIFADITDLIDVDNAKNELKKQIESIESLDEDLANPISTVINIASFPDFNLIIQRFDELKEILLDKTDIEKVKSETNERANKGDTLGDYQLIELLGSGSFATVWKAIRKSDSCLVAIRIFKTDIFSLQKRKEIQAFWTQAHIWRKLSTYHSIVRLLDYGENPIPYIVLEYIEGNTLKEYLKTKILPLKEVIEIIITILDTLTYTHSSGIIHGDLKPENILIPIGGHIKITDWGNIHNNFSDTLSSEISPRTIAYTSPELLKPKSKPDFHSDLYSVGLILYELLTNRLPYQKTDSVISIIYAILEEKILPPSSFRKNIPTSLDLIVLKALNKNRDDRFQTATEFRNSLALIRTIDKIM